MKNDAAAQLSALLKKLHKEREEHLAAIDDIDTTLAAFGLDPKGGAPRTGKRRGPGRPRGSSKKASKKASKRRGKKKTRGLKKGGSRVQGVKQTLEESLTASPQTPAELQEKVSRKLGHEVSVATQLHMLKRDGKAKTVGRGQWVKA